MCNVSEDEAHVRQVPMDPNAGCLDLQRSESLQALVRWHEQGQKRLSVGLELEPRTRGPLLFSRGSQGLGTGEIDFGRH